MMLQKINIIERLGKFQSCSANDPSCHFEQSTVIFAPNGHGKTTLTDIIRSLAEKDPDYIIGRKRLGETVSPKVSISISGQTIQQIFGGDVSKCHLVASIVMLIH